MKKKKKIFLISILIIALIGFTAYNTYRYFTESQSENSGGIIKGSKDLTFNCASKYRYVFIELKADASQSGKKVKYYIVNPAGNILDKGEFSKDYSLNISRQYPGAKGIWHIKFESPASDETINYNLLFASANRKNSIAYYKFANTHFEQVH